MKKIMGVALAALLLLSMVTAAFAEGTVVEEETEYEELRVAVTTPLIGNFFTSMWGNDTSDMDVRALIHGYNLVQWDVENGMFVPDETVVSGFVVTEDGTGDRTYTVSLYEDLTYCDGTPITARDYAFSFLLTMSAEAEAIGASVHRPDYIRGYEQYMSGASRGLAGLRVLNDYQMAFIVKGEYLPFFYELGLLDCVPYPIEVIAPGVRVADDGNGAYLTNVDAGAAEPAFTAELLRSTILDETNGYLSHASVTSGPYKLVSWENGEARFELNPEFKGDAYGNKPTIQKIVFTSMANDELIPALTDGSVTLVNKATGAETIGAGITLTAENDLMTVSNYARTGLSFIGLTADKAPLDDLAVRQALAYAIDKDELTSAIVSNYGLSVNGYFGLGQWMYGLLNGTTAYPVEAPEEGATAEEQAAYEEAIEAWQALSLEDIKSYTNDEENGEPSDQEAAAALLEEAGWKLAEDGMRYKETELGPEPLKLTLCYPAGSAAGEALETELPAMLADVGISLSVEARPMSELLVQYYRYEEPEYDMYFLATNFDLLYEPSQNFVEDENGDHVWKTSGLADNKLYDEAVAMRSTEPGDLMTYCEHWLAFQVEISEELPLLPIYSNVYFDFYSRTLQNYLITTNSSWPQALGEAFLAEYIPEEEAVEEEEEVFEG